MDDELLDEIQDEFDSTHFLRKSGIGWLYWIPNGGWCGPWCCAQIPDSRYKRKYRHNLKRWFTAQRKKSHKRLRNHRE